jgi:hypothetical protein
MTEPITTTRAGRALAVTGAVVITAVLGVSALSPLVAATACLLAGIVALIIPLTLGRRVEAVPAVPDAASRAQARLKFLPGLALLFFAYQLAFNYVSDSRRTAIAMVLGGLAILYCVGIGIRRRADRRVGLAIGLLLAFLAMDLAGTMLGVHGFDLMRVARKFFPLLLGATLIGHARYLQSRFLARVASACALVGSAVSDIGGLAYHSDIVRLQPFTGGSDGTHSSAYVLVCCMMIVIEAYLAGQFQLRWVIVVCAICGYTLIGLAVGTAIVMFACYGLLRFWQLSRSAGLRSVAILIVLVGAVVFSIQRINKHNSAQYTGRSTGVDAFASGRLATWDQRLGFVSERDLGQLVFGAGTGSDSYYSPVWLDAPKDSHEDLITLLLENGVVGYLLLVCCAAAIFVRAGPDARPLAVGFIAASVISNGLWARPMIWVLFWFAVAIASTTHRVTNAADSRHQHGKIAEPQPPAVDPAAV